MKTTYPDYCLSYIFLLFTNRNERTNLNQESLEAELTIHLNGPSPTVWNPNSYTNDYLAAGHDRCDPANKGPVEELDDGVKYYQKSPKKSTIVPNAFEEFDEKITYYSSIF